MNQISSPFVRAESDRAAETAAAASGEIRTLTNAMSVDVEDYFQVQAFAGHIGRGDWDSFDCRVERNTDAVLALFAEADVSATFFTLGWVAERYPRLVRRIADAGHEIASHGMEHVRADSQSPEAFRADVRKAKRLLEDTGGSAVSGYRAATFSIGAKNMWAFDVLAEEGYAYSSSIFPIAHDNYGMPDAPRFPFRTGRQGILEIPMTTMRLAGRNLPCSGGGYFRLLPYPISRWQMRRVNRRDGHPCVFYFHPWEIDPGQPRQQGISVKTRFRHYLNLGRTRDRLSTLLRDFAWDRVDRVFLPNSVGRS